jgi:hypothetical protein
MDAPRFDDLTRAVSSRRTVIGGVATLLGTFAGLLDHDAAVAAPCPNGRKRCGKRCIRRRACCLRTHKRCGGRCIPKRSCCPGTKRCGTKCIPLSQCCTDADCGLRRICASGRCVTGQGTCQAGANICDGVNPEHACGQPRTDCVCLTSTANQTRCGGNGISGACGECFSDADCTRKHPGFPGAFCVQSVGGGCRCPGSTFCMAPCPG